MSTAAAAAAPPSAEELLAHARRLSTGDVADLGATANRAAALLGRSALEEAIWSLYPGLRQVSGRAMLIFLNGALRSDVARRATLAWGRLSAASHHHVYEMPPTAAEMANLLDTVHDVIDAIRDRQERAIARKQAEVAARAGGASPA